MTFEERLVEAGHVLKLDEDGNVDIFVLEYDIHNGPGCQNCDMSWCHHCEDTIKVCVGRDKTDELAKERRYVQYLKLKMEFDNES